MLADFFEPFHRMVKTAKTDDMVGNYYTYSEGEVIMIGCAVNSNNGIMVASQQGAKVSYSLYLPFGVSLSIGDRVKRDHTGLVLSVLTDPKEMCIPYVSRMRYMVCIAEVAE